MSTRPMNYSLSTDETPHAFLACWPRDDYVVVPESPQDDVVVGEELLNAWAMDGWVVRLPTPPEDLTPPNHTKPFTFHAGHASSFLVTDPIGRSMLEAPVRAADAGWRRRVKAEGVDVLLFVAYLLPKDNGNWQAALYDGRAAAGRITTA